MSTPSSYPDRLYKRLQKLIAKSKFPVTVSSLIEGKTYKGSESLVQGLIDLRSSGRIKTETITVDGRFENKIILI